MDRSPSWGRFGSRSPSIGFAINDSGVIVGAAYVPRPLALVWTSTEGGGPGPWDKWAVAADINNHGDVVLFVQGTRSWSLVKRDGRRLAIDIPYGAGNVYGFDDAGCVVGHRWNGTTLGPFRWSEEGGMEDLELPAGFNNGVAYASSGTGMVAGSCITDSWAGRPVLWDAAGRLRMLPVFASNLHGAARGLNADGWVVGFHSTTSLQARYIGTLWFQGVPYELERLIEPGVDVEISSASAVNDAGQILCDGLLNGRPRAMRLDPL
jgi:uncharacterized membrane protein